MASARSLITSPTTNCSGSAATPVGVTDERWELVRTFYVLFEDGIDLVPPVIACALALVTELDRELTVTAEPDEQAPLVDHLADIAHVIGANYGSTRTPC